MGIIKTGIIAGTTYAAVNKLTKAMDQQQQNQIVMQKQRQGPPPHPPCNCPHCPYSSHAIYGSQQQQQQQAQIGNGRGSPQMGMPRTGNNPEAWDTGLPAYGGHQSGYASAPAPHAAYGGDEKKGRM